MTFPTFPKFTPSRCVIAYILFIQSLLLRQKLANDICPFYASLLNFCPWLFCNSSIFVIGAWKSEKDGLASTSFFKAQIQFYFCQKWWFLSLSQSWLLTENRAMLSLAQCRDFLLHTQCALVSPWKDFHRWSSLKPLCLSDGVKKWHLRFSPFLKVKESLSLISCTASSSHSVCSVTLSLRTFMA